MDSCAEEERAESRRRERDRERERLERIGARKILRSSPRSMIQCQIFCDPLFPNFFSKRTVHATMHECSFVRRDVEVGREGGRGTEGARVRERWQKEEEEGGRQKRTRRGRRGPKGLTRALKIENSKWPIFPADGTETKSRPAFIMTCIAVYARLWFALFRCRTQRGDGKYDGEEGGEREEKGTDEGVHIYTRVYLCNVFRIVSNDAGGIEEQWYRGTSMCGKDFGSGCYSKNWRFILRFEKDRQRGREREGELIVCKNIGKEMY